mgnify:CR=1 FL=1
MRFNLIKSLLVGALIGSPLGCEPQPVVDPDFVVAPLAAFDRRGGRIGVSHVTLHHPTRFSLPVRFA